MFLGSNKAFENTLTSSNPYFFTKNAVHHLALQMSTKQELPVTSTVLTLLHETNKEDIKEVPHEQLAFQVRQWVDGIDRPDNGSFAKLDYTDGKLNTTFV